MTFPLTPGFMLVQGNRLEDLRSLAIAWLRRHPLAPLENEVILVQSNGIAQWLKLALAEGPDDDGLGGISAAVDVVLPARLQWQVYRAVLGELPAASPFDKPRLLWRLMRLLPGLLEAPAFAPLQRFLHDDQDQRKRYQLAERLADLLDQYQVYRADWLRDWGAGRDVLGAGDGRAPVPLPDDQHWQARLWRAVLADMPSGQQESSRAGVHQRFLDAAAHLTPDHRPTGLPRRVVVFGISSLPQQVLEVLSAMAGCSQVLLCVLNPCMHYWGDIVEGRQLFRQAYRRSAARKLPQDLPEEALHLHAQPLLAAWGKQGRDYIRLLDEHDQRTRYEPLFQQAALDIDLFESPGGGALLHQLQDDILHLRPLAETRASWPPAEPDQDRSLVFHIAHSPQREVEILHDQLLDAFSKDPTLRPRDVMVMVPDINTYAPHIRAVFGLLERDDPRYIPFTLADQGQRVQSPLLMTLDSLLRMEHNRFAVSDLLDWLDVPALRARFRLQEHHLPTLRRWLQGAEVRWGLHSEQRAALGMPPGLEQNSWRFGLRRMLLGYATGRGEAWQGIEPYDEVGGLEAALAGPLAALLAALERHWRALVEPAPPALWAERLQQLLDDLFLAAEPEEERQLDQLQQALADWLEACESADFAELLPLSVVRDAWLGAVEQPQLTQRFLAGAVNFATLMPMRAIPFRRVCLLGMNDGDYPRRQPGVDFDLMALPGQYRPGDRSRREDDRYLFLEALLSAREQLYISWVGRHIRDNSERSPSVLVAQLRDHLASGWRQTGGDGRALLHALTTEHPLQPFSRRYFPAKGEANGLFSYAREWREVHEQAADGEEHPLPPPALQGALGLRALGDFLRQPVEEFFRQRLQTRLRDEQLASEDDEPFAPDALQEWALRDALLQPVAQRLRQQPEADPLPLLEEHMERQRRAGRLPMPPFDALTAAQLVQPLHAPVLRYRQWLQRWPEADGDTLVSFAHAGLHLEDWLPDLRRRGEARLRLQLLGSRLHSGKDVKWYHLVRQWPAHLAAQLAGEPVDTVLVSLTADARMAGLPAEEAERYLRDHLDAWREGMCRPLPVACKTALALLEKGENAARDTFNGGYKREGERQGSLLLARCWQEYAALAAEENHRDWCERLYGPLMRHTTLQRAGEAAA